MNVALAHIYTVSVEIPCDEWNYYAETICLFFSFVLSSELLL